MKETTAINVAEALTNASTAITVTDLETPRRSRPFMLLFGMANVGLGVTGAVLPVMPSTVFLLIALWAFSKSSPHFHNWLYSHRRFGPSLRAWDEHRVIRPRAKFLAVFSMAASFLYVSVYVAESLMLPTVLAAVLGSVAIFLVTRPSHPPTTNR